MKNHYYVGIKPKGKREVFSCSETPTEKTCGHLYTYAIGPFRTKRGALAMAWYGEGNPNMQTAGEADRLAKLHPEWFKK